MNHDFTFFSSDLQIYVIFVGKSVPLT